MDIAERVDLVGLCRLPFLMGVVARFWEEVCGIVLAGEGEGGVNGRGEVEGAVVGELVWRFKREVEDQIEENVGTRAFEGVCGELGVWESGDEEEQGFEDGDGGANVCGEECESCVRGEGGMLLVLVLVLVLVRMMRRVMRMMERTVLAHTLRIILVMTRAMTTAVTFVAIPLQRRVIKTPQGRPGSGRQSPRRGRPPRPIRSGDGRSE